MQLVNRPSVPVVAQFSQCLTTSLSFKWKQKAVIKLPANRRQHLLQNWYRPFFGMSWFCPNVLHRCSSFSATPSATGPFKRHLQLPKAEDIDKCPRRIAAGGGCARWRKPPALIYLSAVLIMTLQRHLAIFLPPRKEQNRYRTTKKCNHKFRRVYCSAIWPTVEMQ